MPHPNALSRRPSRGGQALVNAIDDLASSVERRVGAQAQYRGRAEKRLYELYFDDAEWDTEDLLDAARLFEDNAKAQVFVGIARDDGGGGGGGGGDRLLDIWLRNQLETLRRREAS
jgi:hypothetical protein